MWFDARAKLAEIVEQPPATSATTATQARAALTVSQLSRVSQRSGPQARRTSSRLAARCESLRKIIHRKLIP